MTDRDPPTKAARDRARARLLRELGSRMLTGEEECAEYRSDDSRIQGRLPDAVVLAESLEDIQKTLRIASETGVPVTPRSGGSGRTGGAVPTLGGIVLSTKSMNRRIDLDEKEGFVTVDPGVILQDLHDSVEAVGWFYPPDPSSLTVSCLAGNVAENAAGPRAFKYGATRDYVLGMDAVLPSGESFFSGRRTKKGVTGYDVTALLVGSEGTLAALGKIVLRLLPKPESTLTLLATFGDRTAAARAVGSIIERRIVPRCIEFLDEKTVAVMRDAGAPVSQAARSLLIVELDGSEADTERQGVLVGEACDEAGAANVEVATSSAARSKLWDARRQMSFAVRKRAKDKLSEDVVVPRRHLVELLDEVERLGETHRIDALAYGHAGDGNLHVNFLFDDDEQKRRVDAAVHDLFVATVRLGGTLSGEHGIGLLKAPYLHLEQSDGLIALQQRLKASFDPAGILNPGKIFPQRGHGSC